MLQFLLCSRMAIWMGFLLDLLLGDPYSFPHPVRLMGRWIAWLDRHLRKENGTTDKNRGEKQEETSKGTDGEKQEETPKGTDGEKQ
ncbi:MAG: cobalamin biosynthesis protein, partial [Lachnospiraceae bacterium]|nr:cobalamin biosynthesis protein [Lachnospiraceae bacterium]